MPEVNQYSVSLHELLTLIVKEAGVHEGRWQLVVNFNLTAGNFGPDAKSVMPGIIGLVQNVGIMRENPNAPIPSPEGLTVDAALVNPRKPK